MTKKAYRKLIAGHLQWSVIGLIIALFVAYVSSDHRSVIYGVPAAESVVSKDLAPATSIAPAAAPEKSPEAVVPDTINGELVWPDPWDRITENERPFY
ncbi:MAG: hypothetical protein ACJAXE_001682 [Neolewinella sp.]|jgi:hypothetical protein